MKAMTYHRYGPAENVQPAELPRPIPGKSDLLIKVHTATVTTADWRLRASAFPGGMWLPGRLMFGLFRPRKKVLGGEFSGTVMETGTDVCDFAPGDPVFGFAGLGAHAEYLTIPAKGCVTKKPARLSHAEAAAMPFGGLSSLVFLRDFAKLKPGHKVLILGASGGVGVYAVQIAKAMGAEVTAMASTAKLDLLRDLGADQVLDYTVQQLNDAGRDFDLVFDPAGNAKFPEVKALLKPTGLFIPLTFNFREVWQALRAKLTGGPQIGIGVNGDHKTDLLELANLIETGALRPVVDQRFDLVNIAAAYGVVESRHRKGSIVLEVLPTHEELS
ncbi:Beta-ketoacyl-acyl-carrier-protein synthase I [Thalassovita gelatinovora]|uniref:Beta-ketoacyl-acyl-carrier-protein synthase I n=1 Tax=Thalassovita gelatinovora TaxID=53501 RepID=A0A0P1F609_THAGE|nr:NAD(P)-dependent alcohol dehydrogenase [Thalassovita gelatinovora]QIZ80808.1 NAD(P)-dependent alcohol dehydrogenase [Thalassovita gelatinovora]CUH63206.1 Beta-ketoacyl-acyl-carrier-protein synthase I [Thalassovita gelatinovora]SEQ63418.1 NADPH:quinone reductase [Thalassovita gelatinovora]